MPDVLVRRAPCACLQALASNLLARAKDLATSDELSSTTTFQLSLMLANTQTSHATELLKADAPADQSTFTDAISLLQSANEVVENLGADEDDPEVEAKTAAAHAMLAQVCQPCRLLQPISSTYLLLY